MGKAGMLLLLLGVGIAAEGERWTGRLSLLLLLLLLWIECSERKLRTGRLSLWRWLLLSWWRSKMIRLSLRSRACSGRIGNATMATVASTVASLTATVTSLTSSEMTVAAGPLGAGPVPEEEEWGEVFVQKGGTVRHAQTHAFLLC